MVSPGGRLGAGWCSRRFVSASRRKERKGRIIGGIGEIDCYKVWVIESPYNMTSMDGGGLFDFMQPPRPVGDPDEQRDGHKTGTINIGSKEAIELREV